VERARIATNASGAALALRQGDDIVCLAVTGSSAPEIGARLNLNSGLSGACAQSQSSQRCDDSETDARVDPELCRRLGIRSMLVVPILRRGVLLGIVEVFSPSAHAFGDGEVQALASLSRTISYILDPSAEVAAVPQASGEVPPQAAPEAPSTSAPETAPGDEPQPSATSGTEVALPVASTPDHWTTVLTVAVILLAIALGWLLGHGGLRRLSPTAGNPAPANPASLAQPAIKVPASASADVNPASAPEAAKEKPASSVAPKGEPAASPTVHPGELVIFQNGRVIYRQPGSQPARRANLAPSAPSLASAQTGVSNAVLISPETANQYVAQRVEPEYPEQAREQHIQGPVTLQVIVAKDGSVKSLKTISGDSQLAAAARRAVSQWRFKPFLQEGKPAEFQTQVTVNFRLP
jgi:TonB family protein